MDDATPSLDRRHPVAGKAARRLSEGLRQWAQLRAPRPQSLVEVTRAVDRFILLKGDLPFHLVNAAEAMPGVPSLRLCGDCLAVRRAMGEVLEPLHY